MKNKVFFSLICAGIMCLFSGTLLGETATFTAVDNAGVPVWFVFQSPSGARYTSYQLYGAGGQSMTFSVPTLPAGQNYQIFVQSYNPNNWLSYCGPFSLKSCSGVCSQSLPASYVSAGNFTFNIAAFTAQKVGQRMVYGVSCAFSPPPSP